MGKRFLLDTSALLALIEDEEGADRVEEVLKSGSALLPWVALMEVCYVTVQKRGHAEAQERYVLMESLPVEMLWVADERVLWTSVRFKAHHQVSLADSIIAAFALCNDAILLHKDPDFDVLKHDLPLEALPYKRDTAR